MLNGFYRSNRKIKGNVFHALQNVKPEYLLSPLKGEGRVAGNGLQTEGKPR